MLLSTAGTATAQDLEPPAERWRIALDLAFTNLSGNESLTVLTTGARVTHLWTDRYKLETGAQARYGRSEGEVVARNLRGSLTFDFNPNGAWTPFVFATAEHDPLRQVQLRLNSGAGAKHTFWRRDGQGEASISLAALYSYEDYTLTLGSAAEQWRANARWSWRFKGERRIGDATRVEQIMYYQPIWDRASDYLMAATSSLRVRISENIGLRVSYAYERDSTPLPDIRKDDHRVETGLSVEF